MVINVVNVVGDDLFEFDAVAADDVIRFLRFFDLRLLLPVFLQSML
jgi:hypothetical protein